MSFQTSILQPPGAGRAVSRRLCHPRFPPSRCEDAELRAGHPWPGATRPGSTPAFRPQCRRPTQGHGEPWTGPPGSRAGPGRQARSVGLKTPAPGREAPESWAQPQAEPHLFLKKLRFAEKPHAEPSAQPASPCVQGAEAATLAAGPDSEAWESRRHPDPAGVQPPTRPPWGQAASDDLVPDSRGHHGPQQVGRLPLPPTQAAARTAAPRIPSSPRLQAAPGSRGGPWR